MLKKGYKLPLTRVKNLLWYFAIMYVMQEGVGDFMWHTHNTHWFALIYCYENKQTVSQPARQTVMQTNNQPSYNSFFVIIFFPICFWILVFAKYVRLCCGPWVFAPCHLMCNLLNRCYISTRVLCFLWSMLHSFANPLLFAAIAADACCCNTRSKETPGYTKGPNRFRRSLVVVVAVIVAYWKEIKAQKNTKT